MLEVQDLKVHFPIGSETVRAVDGVNFSIARRETLGLVGESGCGMSTLGRAVLHLIRPTSGSIDFDGTDLAFLKATAMRRLRARMQIIFQDFYSSLDRRMRIGEIIAEPLKVHGVGDRQSRAKRVSRDMASKVWTGARTGTL